MNIYKPFGIILQLILICTILSSALSAPAHSMEYQEQNNTFKVRGIDVFFEAGNLEDSKTLAINNGAKQALIELLSKITPHNTHWKINSIIERISIKDVTINTEIIAERMTSSSYRGKINYTLDMQRISDILNENGIRYTKASEQKVLIIPILHQENGKLSILADNPWRNSWRHTPHRVGLTNFTFLEEDLDDIKLISSSGIMTESYDNYESIINDYKVDKIAAILATELKNKIEFSIRLLGHKENSMLYTSIPRKGNETKEELYKRAAYNIGIKIDSFWKGEKSFDTDKLFSSKALIAYSKKKELDLIYSDIKSMKNVKDVKISPAKNHTAEISIIYSIGPSVLSDELKSRGYEMKEKSGSMLIIKTQ